MLRALSLRDFRNIERLDIDIPETGMAIVGENGHGKTNVLESIAYLALLRSLRGARDQDAVRFGASAFHVRATLTAPARVERVSVGFDRATKRKKASIDGVEVSRLTDALGAVPSVCFSPADVALAADGPAERRRFLDVVLALTIPPYLQALQGYRQALKQRNAALRIAQRDGARASSHEARVAVWEVPLAQHGAQLSAHRLQWCSTYRDRYTGICASIGERDAGTLRYSRASLGTERSETIDAAAMEASYRACFEAQRRVELKRGVTLVGPHRDELQLLLGDRDIRTFGSAGQQRTAAIALRLLELTTLTAALGRTPLLLLDDPFAELDTRRSERILALLESARIGQVILAVPRESEIPHAFTRLLRRRMVDGVLT